MHLDLKRTFLIGFAFFSISLFWTAYDGEVPKILQGTFHLTQFQTGFIMALDNILALFMLPLFGWLSDRTKTRLGRRMPYILIGSVVAAALLLLLPVVDFLQIKDNLLLPTGGVAQNTANYQIHLTLFIVLLGLLLFTMGVYRSPAVALMPDVTPKPLRSKANAIINLMGAFGGIISLALIGILVKPNQSRFPLFAMISLFLIITFFVLYFFVNEPRLVEKMKAESKEDLNEDIVSSPEEEKPLSKEKIKSLILILLSIFLWFMGYNAVSSSFSIYADKVLGMTGGAYSRPLLIAQICSIIAFYPIALVGSKIGRRKTILMGIALLSSAFLIISFLTANTSIYILYGLFALAGIGWASITINSYPMVVELSQGSNVGKFTGYYYTFSMAAQIITPMFSGFLIDTIGGGQAYYILFPYGALFVGLAFVTMYFVKFGDSQPIGKINIEVFSKLKEQ